MKRIIRLTLALALMALVPWQAQAQDFGAPEEMKWKFVVGGDADLGFAGSCFYVGVSPQLGFRLTRNLEIGVRLGYDLEYYYGYYGNSFYHYFSGATYVNYELFSGIYLHVEDEELCSLVSVVDAGSPATQWYNSLFVGAGYRQYFNETCFSYYSVLYNLSWNSGFGGSPYANPFIVRVGICKGLKWK